VAWTFEIDELDQKGIPKILTNMFTVGFWMLNCVSVGVGIWSKDNEYYGLLILIAGIFILMILVEFIGG
jgi:hypothetical protein